MDELIQHYPNGGVDGGAYHTGAYNIRTTQHIIHTIGPDYRNYGLANDAAAQTMITNAYTNSMKVAKANGITSIAFPTLSTGIFRFPKEAACQLALGAVRKFLDQQQGTYRFKRIVFLVYDPKSVSPDLVHYNANFQWFKIL